jgi:hypothetical protein
MTTVRYRWVVTQKGAGASSTACSRSRLLADFASFPLWLDVTRCPVVALDEPKGKAR